ncbi:ATP-dependent DNA helicase RecQ [Butyricicoccus sp. AM28-25]|jgi:RecQ family ATP-dependent DNA helicase|nr:RecQ family ATP-dependent DNA helicase [Butyricicoccus sp. AM28-25]RHT75162.1 ATP-dependent DNA helicase RecQ [Butyricicoccus sp. AM28-25]
MSITINEHLTEALKKLGIANLRLQQEAPMEAILNNEDVIVLMPTSGGKSLLYQLPAVMEHGSLTLVISPLKALQLDQVESLHSKGIRAAVLNSDLSAAEHRDVLEDMTRRGGLLYLAPEQLQNMAVADALRTANLTRIAVDEAHTLPQAKDDFRKAYGKVGSFIHSLPHRPQVIALTATATRNDVSRIRKSLGIPNAERFRTPLRRDNLHLCIKHIGNSKIRKGKRKPSTENVLFQSVERELSKWDEDGAVIIYCPTVKLVKRLCKWLKARDYPVGKYHGKMKHAKRKAAQQAFMRGKKPIMVATNAFGLGIDKPDVRLVIHAGLSLSMDGYTQEIGRAGRDGKKSRCVLFYAKSDFDRNRRILSRSGGRKAVARRLKRLHALRGLVDSKKCLWRVIEKYFGEKPQKKCEKCCRCRQKSV